MRARGVIRHTRVSKRKRRADSAAKVGEMEFDIPLALTDLEAPQREGAIGPKDKIDVAGMSDGEANSLVERVAYDLCENDALCILEQEASDRVHSCQASQHVSLPRHLLKSLPLVRDS